jgi:predicted nucleic acid-binding protein
MTARSLPIQTGIRSEMLGHLRKIEGLKRLLGPLAQFVVVLDANIILGDLIWLVSKRKKPDARTELMECIQAGTIVAYITRTVLVEIDEHITTIAADKDLPEEALRQAWKTYRKLIKVRTPRKALVDRHKGGQDPDDAPTLALAKMLRADGILSKDTDIVAMGGLVIEIDFTRQARGYSRKTAVAATIRYSGGIALTVSWVVIDVALKSIKGFVARLRELPVLVQAIIFVAVIAIASNKKAQGKVIAMVEKSTSLTADWSFLLRLLARVGATLAENTVPAPTPMYIQQPSRKNKRQEPA